jgi:hypothetical protein
VRVVPARRRHSGQGWCGQSFRRWLGEPQHPKPSAHGRGSITAMTTPPSKAASHCTRLPGASQLASWFPPWPACPPRPRAGQGMGRNGYRPTQRRCAGVRAALDRL